jgi:hypothetical protein
LHWSVTNVKSVLLNGGGVAGVATQQVCPTATTLYVLSVNNLDGTSTSSYLTIWVVPSNTIVIHFWAEQYTLAPSTCTILHWGVDGVQSVYLRVPGVPDTGVSGHAQQKECPQGTETYSIMAFTADARSARADVTLQPTTITIGPSEVIAQGIIASVTELENINPNSVSPLNGYQIVVDAVEPIVKSGLGCCQTEVNLWIPKAMVNGTYATQVDWPIVIGQLIEFRLPSCDATDCKVYTIPSTPFYIKLRSS